MKCFKMYFKQSFIEKMQVMFINNFLMVYKNI